MTTLQLYSRPQCHLCEQLADELLALHGNAVRVEFVDISDDPVLLRRYGLRIPVLCCGAEELSGYPLDLARVRDFLATKVD